MNASVRVLTADDADNAGLFSYIRAIRVIRGKDLSGESFGAKVPHER